MRLTIASVGALVMLAAALWGIAVLLFDKNDRRAWVQETIVLFVLLIGFGFACGAAISDAVWTLNIEHAVREAIERSKL